MTEPDRSNNAATPRESPVQQVVEALDLGVRVVGDYDQKALEGFLGDVTSLAASRASRGSRSSPERYLLLKTPFSKPLLAPWLALAESVINGRGDCGAVVDVLDGEGLKKTLQTLGGSSERLEEAGRDCHAVNTAPVRIDPRPGPSDGSELAAARRELAAVASIEALAAPGYSARFSRLAGGLRPIVVVLDDYNNYIRRSTDGLFQPAGRSGGEAVNPENGVDRANEFTPYLKSHCATLNNLSIAFAVDAPPMWVADGEEPGYERVAEVLPFDRFDQRRDRIGAFVVDLQWLPFRSGDATAPPWRRMGLRALKLLAARYPEVPSFVYTGQWSDQRLQDGLVHGASWCFQKRESHHAPYIGDEAQALTCLSLESQLTAAIEARYGAYSDPPDPGQLRLEGGAAKDLREQRGITLPIQRGTAGYDLQRVVASLFPNATRVTPNRIPESGRSSDGTIVVDVDRPGGQVAKRFVKLASWSAAVGEWMACRRVIEPRLNSQVAQFVSGPVMVPGDSGQEPKGAIAYSLAGLPESSDLCSLGDLIRRAEGSEDLVAIRERVGDTCRQVLAPLYGSRRRVTRPLWSWLGEVLPPLVTGDLIAVGEEHQHSRWAVDPPRDGHEYGSAERVAAAIDTLAVTDGGECQPTVCLDGFELSGMDADRASTVGQFTVRHPCLGFRIRLRGDPGDIRRRLGAAWIRPGMPVHVQAQLDAESRDIRTLRQRVHQAGSGLGQRQPDDLVASLRTKLGLATAAVDPVKVFALATATRLQFGVDALEGPTHGDLNLENLMFSGERGPAWLIDFERASERGMVAFDLAKLEIELWNHTIFPLLEDCPQRLEALSALLAVVDEARAGELHDRLTDRCRTPHHDLKSERLEGLAALVCDLRKFGCRTLGLTPDEAQWARAAYAFASLKFVAKGRRSLLAYAASIWHLSGIVPRFAKHEEPAKLFDAIRTGQSDVALRRRVDGFVLDADKACCEARVVRAAAGPSIAWPAEPSSERWDVASTGSATDLTALFGHLWLRVRAEGEGTGTRKILAPKISARGTSVGFIDVLESGGYAFPRDLEEFKYECTRTGVSISREELVPVDAELLARRRAVGAMKNGALTYLSIISKLVAAGCTHAVVDVKCGFDTKMRLPGCPELASTEPREGSSATDSISAPLDRLEAFLEDLGTAGVEPYEKDGTSWLTQTCAKELSPLQEVRWYATNANLPQGRAIGRTLTLLHLHGLITGSYGSEELPEVLLRNGNEWSENPHARFYGSHLSALCDVPVDQATPDALAQAWAGLRDKMHRLEHDAIFRSVDGWMADLGEKSERLVNLELNTELAVFSIGAPAEVTGFDMYRLDRLFQWLCGPDPMDPAVGIWLHALPGEQSVQQKPLISVVFRPARTPARVVAERLRHVVHDGCRMMKNEPCHSKESGTVRD